MEPMKWRTPDGRKQLTITSGEFEFFPSGLYDSNKFHSLS